MKVVLSPDQLAALDEQAKAIDLASIGFTLDAETAKAAARWEGRTPEQFAHVVAAALSECWMERRANGGRLFPYSVRLVERAILLRMEP